jgi:glucosamine--fructose-6-phosphate aminotransferase (isomerizing)
MLSEMVGQPEALRRASAALQDQRTLFGELRGAAARARVFVFTGMGGSYNACYPAINELAARGIAALQVDSAELLHFRKSMLDSDVLLVMASQSGESAEVVALASEVRGQGARSFIVSVTNGLDNSLAGAADLPFDTRAGAEAGPSTITFAASLVTLAGVARVMSGTDPDEAVTQTIIDSGPAAAAAERLLNDPEARAADLARWHDGRETVVLLARGSARAASEMGALLLKEAVGIPAESLQTAQFRHGPLELAGPHMAAIVVATEQATHDLDVALAANLAASDAAVLLVSPDGDAPEDVRVVATGHVDRLLAPAAGTVPAQLLAWRLAIERGREPGRLRRATKVTTSE